MTIAVVIPLQTFEVFSHEIYTTIIVSCSYYALTVKGIPSTEPTAKH